MNEELRIKIVAEIDKAQKNLKEAQEEVEKVGKEAKESSGKFNNAMNTIGTAAKTAGKVVAAGVKAAIASVAALGTALVAAAEGTVEFRQNQAQLGAAFKQAGLDAKAATDAHKELFKIIGDDNQATESAANIAMLANSEKEAAQWAELASGVLGTFHDTLQPEAFYEAANETLKLNEATGAFTQMLEQTGVVSVEEFNSKLAACTTEAEKQAYMLSVSSKAMGEAGATYDEATASIQASREAQLLMTKSLADMGAAAEPIITIFKQGIGEALQTLTPHIQTISQGFQDMMNGVDGGAEKMKSGIEALSSGVSGFITNLLPTVLSVGIDIVLALVDGIIAAIPTLNSALLEAIPKLLDGLNKMVGALVEALPTVLEAVLAALPTIITTIMDGVVGLLPKIINSMVKIIVLLCNNLTKIINPIIKALPDIITAIVDGLLGNLPLLVKGLITLTVAVVGAIPQIIKALVDALPSVIAAIIDGLLSCLPQLIVGLVKVVAALVVSIPSILEALIMSVINTFVGLWNGITKVFSKVGSWFKDTFSSAFKNIKSAFSGITNYFSDVWSKIKNIFSKVGSTIAKAISNTVKSAINGVLSSAIKVINGFISAINTAITVINAIPGVSISKLNKLSVPKLAKGGIVDSATLAVIGEQGKEAVVPLENNTEWMDKLATMLADKMGRDTPVVLNVDGKVFAQTAISTLNNRTKQTGKLDLILM